MQRNRPPLNCNFIQIAQSSKTICSLPIILECQTFCHNWCYQVAILNAWPICSMYSIGIVFIIAYSICSHLGCSIRVYPEFQWNVDNDIIQLNSNNTPKTAFQLFLHSNSPDNIYFIDLIRSLHLQNWSWDIGLTLQHHHQIIQRWMSFRYKFVRIETTIDMEMESLAIANNPIECTGEFAFISFWLKRTEFLQRIIAIQFGFNL